MFFKERNKEVSEERRAGVLRTLEAVSLVGLVVLVVTNFFVLPHDSSLSDSELLSFIKSAPPSTSWTDWLIHEALGLTPVLHKQALMRMPVILALEKQTGRSSKPSLPR